MGLVTRRRAEPELLDGTAWLPAELAGNLADIRWLNRWFGGTRAVIRQLGPLLRRHPGGPLSVIDVGTGSADIPVAICRWAERHGYQPWVLAVDRSPAVARVARGRAGGDARIQLLVGDVRALEFKPGSFDLAVASQVMHHLNPEDAVCLLRKLQRWARLGVVVADLRRGRVGYLLTRLLVRARTRNRLTRADAPLSVLRAYTPEEVRRLARAAGLVDVRVCRARRFRLVLTSRQGER